MSIDKINVPKDLMENVEDKLRKHVENKKRRLRTYAAVAVISMAFILPVSVYAYSKYSNQIPFKQEVDLARQNNNITKVNKTFKYKNVKFNIKEIVADETGMEVIYEVSNPKYTISGLSLGDERGKAFKSGGYGIDNFNVDEEEKALYVEYGKDEVDYMGNNPVTFNFNYIFYKSSDDNNKLWAKINSFLGIKDDILKIDWNLKVKVPMQEMKTIPINKEFNLNIGKLKLKALHEGVLKTILEYEFISSDKKIGQMRPLFSIRMDKEYTNNIENNIENNGFRSDCLLGYYSGAEEFKSMYYKKINEIGIRLVGASVVYNFDDTKEYEVFKDKLPMEFDYDGEKFKVVSIVEKENSIDYTFEFCKNDKIYNVIYINMSHPTSNMNSSIENIKVKFKDQEERDKIYNSLAKKVPDLNSIYDKAGDRGAGIEKGVINQTFSIEGKNVRKFRIDGASRSFLYDNDEIVIKP